MLTPTTAADSLQSLAGRPTLVTIGNFDGVHLGHRAVLQGSVAAARAMQLVPVVLTFDPHPTVAVGRPSPACLTSIERKIDLIRRVDPSLVVLVQHFDAAFAAQSPEQFARMVLVEGLGARAVRVGDNFRFGAGRMGDLQTLRSLGEQLGFSLIPIDTLTDGEGRYSSTRARSCIAKGDVRDAARILGRPHALTGVVVQGQQLARTLGFPTANMAWIPEALPPHGVYTVAVDQSKDSQPFRRIGVGIANIGVRPTVDAGFATEVHLFDFEGDLYASRIRAHLIDFVRSERKFHGVQELVAQIERDVALAKEQLKSMQLEQDGGQAWF